MSTDDFKKSVIGKLRSVFEIQEVPTHHIRYKIRYKGQKVAETYCSLGSGGKEIFDPILSRMKNQLRLNKTEQLYDLKNCPMTAMDYLNLLKQKNVISH